MTWDAKRIVPMVRRLMARWRIDPADWDDAKQAAYLAILQRPDKPVYTSAWSGVGHWKEEEYRRRRLLLGRHEPPPVRHDLDTRLDVQMVMSRLSDQEQALLRAHYWLGQSWPEIAVGMEITTASAKGLARRARGKLRCHLDGRP